MKLNKKETNGKIFCAYSTEKSMVLAKKKKIHIDQWNIAESPEVYPCIDGQLTYNKGASVNQNIVLRKLHRVSQKNEKGPLFYTMHKIN